MSVVRDRFDRAVTGGETANGKKTFWAEFYNIGADSGIRFRVMQVSLCGDVLRVELLPRRGYERWHFVAGSPYDNFRLGGKEYSDFGCSATAFRRFKAVDPWKLEGLEEQ